MSIFFGENFKKLRKNRDLTQEQIAEVLGVSSQAVSKWECGTALPDISLLPVIANLFCVSSDYLLGIDIGERENEIYAIINEAELLCMDKRYADAVTLLRDALSKYPSEPRLMYGLAWNLTGTIKEHRENLWEAIRIYEKILEISDDAELRAKVTRDLIYRYSTADDVPKALEIAKTLPAFEFCREYIIGYANLLEGRQLSEYLQANIRLFGDAIRECLAYFQDEKIISAEDMYPYSVESAKHKMELLLQILEE